MSKKTKKDINFSQIYVLPNGEEIKVSEAYMGRYLRCHVQRIYKDEKKQSENHYMDEKWKNCDCKKVEKFRNLYNWEKGEEYQATDTFVLAENKNWQEYETVKEYDGERCINVKNHAKAEILLMSEEWSRRIILQWKGNCHLYDMLSDLPETLWEEFCERKHFAEYYEKGEIFDHEVVKLEFYTEDGDYNKFEFYEADDLEKLIASVRVVEFKREITKD